MTTAERTAPAWTVFLVDDHEVIRRGVAGMLGSAPDLVVTGQAGTAAEAFEQIAVQQPDVALLDVVLPDGSGIDVCRELRSLYPQMQCLILTAHDEGEAFLAAVMGGACGWLTKHVDSSVLRESVRKAAQGQRLVHPDMVQRLVDQLCDSSPGKDLGPGLTDQQKRILRLVACGHSNTQIAEALSVRKQTVKTQISLIFARTGLQHTMRAAEEGGRPWFDADALADLTLDSNARNRLTP